MPTDLSRKIHEAAILKIAEEYKKATKEKAKEKPDYLICEPRYVERAMAILNAED